MSTENLTPAQRVIGRDVKRLDVEAKVRGRAGYVVNPATVTDRDGAGRMPGPTGNGIGQDGTPVEQRPYDVTNQQWFRDTDRLMTTPFVPLATRVGWNDGPNAFQPAMSVSKPWE